MLVSSYPQILISLCSCVFACILVSLHSHILRVMCPNLHPCIFMSSGLYVLPYSIVSSHPLILRLMYSVCLLVSSHPYILISSGSCALTCIHASLCPQVCMCFLTASYPHILLSLGSCTPGACWYPRILTSSYPYISYLFRKLMKTIALPKKQHLWKQIMALISF